MVSWDFRACREVRLALSQGDSTRLDLESIPGQLKPRIISGEEGRDYLNVFWPSYRKHGNPTILSSALLPLAVAEAKHNNLLDQESLFTEKALMNNVNFRGSNFLQKTPSGVPSKTLSTPRHRTKFVEDSPASSQSSDSDVPVISPPKLISTKASGAQYKRPGKKRHVTRITRPFFTPRKRTQSQGKISMLID